MYAMRSSLALLTIVLTLVPTGLASECKSYLAIESAKDVHSFGAFCTTAEVVASAGCLCHLRLLRIIKGFGPDLGRKRVFCKSFGDLVDAKKYCRYLAEPPYSVFATLMWLDYFSRYCYGGSILSELDKNSPYRRFFQMIENGARTPPIPPELTSEKLG
ncbi:hypothetical protein BWQ96_07664 [Gracilariopsis chorda]|uniref:Uncharacterized protein n=1 Tax=Gracilariopsis chorda TaxID=448386 RepID=A0A2V3IKI6_9FLOR|nr:hypothetical protein BWQ96_07664 [Gracilariopsis chorda]|eukprot:PXF42614.1 hypothetical protein BWQ96_07664 [Gracilariopsis chorda]